MLLRGSLILLLTAAARMAAGQAAPAVAAAPEAAVGLRVDTAGSPNREILALWRAYLNARPHTYEPKSQWSREEQRRWPIFDLAMPAVYQSDAEYVRTRAVVVGIEPARPGDTTSFVIRTLFTRPDSASGRELPVALTRIYAVRERRAWVLANALPRLTEGWRSSVVGPITFIYPPEHRFDAARARRSVRFIDSLVTTFGAPRPKHVTYYLARTPEEAFRLGGLDFVPPGGTARSVPANYMVFSGLPSYGEFYPHELTHVTLGWLDPPPPPVLDEGLAFWLGGSRGKSWPTLLRELAAALRADPSLTLEQLVISRPPTDSLRPTAAGALLQLAHERGSMKALKKVLSPGTPAGRDVLRRAEEVLGLTRAELERGWQDLVLRSAK